MTGRQASPPFNVLISSAGRRVALVEIFQDVLRRLEVPGRVLVGDRSRWAATFAVADGAFTVPSIADPDFVPALLAVCEAQAVRLLVPTIDPELPVLASNRDRFADVGTTVAVSSSEVVAIGHDKVATHAWLVAGGFPTVRQAGVGDVLEREQDWTFPVLVKPRRGSSSVGVCLVGDADELRRLGGNGDLVVQAIAPGDEYTIDILTNRNGRCVCAVPRRRVEVRAGEISKGVTVRHAGLIELATCLSDGLPGAYGVLNLQVFLDPGTGDMRVIELNPRFGGGFPLTSRAGGDFALWMIEELLDRPSSASASTWQAGLAMLRYDAAVFLDELVLTS